MSEASTGLPARGVAPAPEGAGRARRNGRILGLLAGLVVLGFVVVALARGWDTVSAHDWRLSPAHLLLGIALLAFCYLGSGLTYTQIVRLLQPVGPPRLVVLSIWARSLLGRYVPGSVLMVLGRTELGRRAGVARRVSLAATIYEQAIALVSAAVGAIVFIALHGDAAGAGTRWLVILVPLMLVPLHPRIFRPVSAWALRKIRREPLEVELTAAQVAALLCSYAVTSFALGVSAWALVRGAAGPSGDVIYVGLGFLLAFTVSSLAIVFPSGLGVRDGAFALVLTRNLAGGVAAAASVGLRLVTIAFELVFVAALTLAARGASRILREAP